MTLRQGHTPVNLLHIFKTPPKHISGKLLLENQLCSIFLLHQVCEVYRLHRETFYLAVDYVDRYLSVERNIAKTRLQLVGVTALFAAAKMEVRLL